MNFIEKALKVHKGLYSYEKIRYINNKTKIEITCKIHGSFWQLPYNHLQSKGCPKCKFNKLATNTRLSKSEFINKSIEKHGNKYNYDKVIYKNTRTKVRIICPEHGEFEQLPLNHFRHGCKECSCIERSNKQAKTNKQFIEKAIEIHGNRYDYTKVNYKNAHSKISIICRTHGFFKQTPNSHLRGRGCRKCKGGKGHPNYGKSTIPCSYCGTYKGTIFRSLPELFWMIKCDKECIKYLGIDEPGLRQKWQVEIYIGNKPGTYCADFYLEETNEIIEIKPLWRQYIQREKLKIGREEYEKRGYNFRIVDTDTIKVSISTFKTMVKRGEIILTGKAQQRFLKRFS